MRVWSGRFCLGVSPRCFDLLSDLIRCCHGGFSLGRKWGQGGGVLWQKWGMVSRMLFKRITLSDSLGIAESLILILHFHSPAFILLSKTGTRENQPLQTFVRGVSPLRGVRYGVINKSASNVHRRRHNHEECKVKNPDIPTEQGCFCLFVVRLTVKVLFEQL